MATIFRFRMLSDENDNFLREYDVPKEMNLRDFHYFLSHDLHYATDQMASFFLSDGTWEKGCEFTLEEMGLPQGAGPMAMADVTLDRIIRQRKDRLIWVFDPLNDRACYLELIEESPAETGVRYPRTAVSQGNAPDQFDAEEHSGGGSIFDEAMAEFNDFEGDDNYSDDEY